MTDFSSMRFEPDAPSPFRRIRWIGVAGATLLGIGTFMPWIVATDANLGVTVTRPGFDAGTSGLTVLVFAVVCGIALFLATRVSAWAAVVAAALALLLCVADLFPPPDLISYLGLPSTASVGYGLWISIAGAIGALVVALYGTNALRNT